MAKRYVNAGTPNFYPDNESFATLPQIVDCLVAGCVPERPILDKNKCIVAFGSCFADHVSNYLKSNGYNVATRDDKSMAYIASMGDGIVHTFAVRQQFEWAWLNKTPAVDLWYGYDARTFGYLEEVRVETRQLLNQTDVFILTLGLSEIWYDKPTGEVFWRVLPTKYVDKARHKFRVATHAENLDNLRAVIALIREQRPQAKIVFTLSPIGLKATYRPLSGIVANEASKARIRSALDELMVESNDKSLFYFPSYELVRECFNNPYTKDRRHIYKHIVDFVMTAFDHYFCGGVTAGNLVQSFITTRKQDHEIGMVDIGTLQVNAKWMLAANHGRLQKVAR